jgi:hypothetical protein
LARCYQSFPVIQVIQVIQVIRVIPRRQDRR